MRNPLHSVELVVLCGGRGVRLKPLTDKIPKALVPIRGRPMLDHIVDFFREKGFNHCTFCVGYRSERIREHFGEPDATMRFTFSDSGESASMLQRLWALRDSTHERFLVVYGDTFINLDLASLLVHHQRSGSLATLVTAEIRNPFGIITFDANHRIETFQEKPLHNHYIGCLVLEREAFTVIDPTMLALPDGEGLLVFFQHLIAQRRLSAFPHTGLQITFNTETERQRAEQELLEYFTYPEQNP